MNRGSRPNDSGIYLEDLLKQVGSTRANLSKPVIDSITNAEHIGSGRIEARPSAVVRLAAGPLGDNDEVGDIHREKVKSDR